MLKATINPLIVRLRQNQNIFFRSDYFSTGST
jgi:hypothetical protein